MLNVIAVMGRLVADPELRKTNSGISTTTFTIACERNFVNAAGERETDFFDVVAWRGTAEFVDRYFQKGQLIAINGWLQTRTYQTKEGHNRKVHEIVAEQVNFAGSKPKENKRETQQPDIPGEQTEMQTDGGNEDFAIIDDTKDLPF